MSCRERIDEFLGRDLSRWTGLPTGCGEPAVTAAYPFLDGFGETRRGRADVTYTFRVLQHPRFPRDVEFFFAGSELAFIESEYWSADAAECALTLRQLGSAEQALDLYWDEEVIPGAQGVFASKGAAAGVVPASGIIVALTVFPPCTVDEYVARYQLLEHAREFRARRPHE